MTLTKIQKRAITTMHNSFTWKGDNCFRTYAQASRCLDTLEVAGICVREVNEYGSQYVLTDAGREAYKWEVNV